MQVSNLEDLKELSAADFVKKELAVTDNFKLLLICFEPGQWSAAPLFTLLKDREKSWPLIKSMLSPAGS